MLKPERVPRDWLEHGASEKLRRHLAAQTEVALNALFAACRRSSDPAVRQHIVAVDMLGDFANIVKLEQEGSEEDDGADTGTDGD